MSRVLRPGNEAGLRQGVLVVANAASRSGSASGAGKPVFTRTGDRYWLDTVWVSDCSPGSRIPMTAAGGKLAARATGMEKVVLALR